MLISTKILTQFFMQTLSTTLMGDATQKNVTIVHAYTILWAVKFKCTFGTFKHLICFTGQEAREKHLLIFNDLISVNRFRQSSKTVLLICNLSYLTIMIVCNIDQVRWKSNFNISSFQLKIPQHFHFLL